MNLQDLPVLVLDCQTTGASPAKGHLLEIGWSAAQARQDPEEAKICAHLIQLPNPAGIPRHISRLTGIQNEDMAQAISRPELWRRLEHASRAACQGRTDVHCVAHFARFERQFIEQLAVECGPSGIRPWDYLCTHEIARRLFPDLPRRGLRALAGYCGAPLGELKRAEPHVRATLHVWHHLVRMLREERQVTRLEELRALLAESAPARGGRWSYPLPRECRLALPQDPGVYRFLARDGSVLYVGKASSLKARVNSYYRKRRGEDRLLELVSQASDLAVTVTASSIEAALLEAEEIKRIDPPYNRALRDTGEGVWFFTRDLERAHTSPGKSRCIGPLPNRDAVAALRILPKVINGTSHRGLAQGRLARSLGLDGRMFQPDALLAGIDRFAAEHGLTRGAQSARALRTLGLQLHRAHLGEIAKVLAQEEAVQAEEQERRLDAAGASRITEELIVGAARGICRGRWLTLISEASICWHRGRTRRVVVLERGVVREARALARRESCPLPPGHARARVARLQAFDRATYDRLRVLTTELRRLIAQDRQVEVHLKPGRVLDPARLALLFQYI